jgi:hypothetical protein
MLRRLLPSWLLALADPAGPGAAAPRRAMPASMLGNLFDRAERHGVLPAVLANFRAMVQQQGIDRVVRAGCRGLPRRVRQATLTDDGTSTWVGSENEPTHGTGTGSSPEVPAALAAAERTLARRIAFTLVLRAQWAEIRAAMARSSLPIVVLKGPEFADRLYARPALRTYTDLDLLVPPRAAGDAARVIESLGYQSTRPDLKYDQGYGEVSFRRSGAGGMVELHTNLVNSPPVREGVSVAFDDLQYEPAGGEAAPRRPTAASLLAIAAVHGAASHGFDRLQILCDVAQAARGAAGELDEAWLESFAGRGRAGLALATALDLSGRLLREPRCRQLRQRLILDVPVKVRLLLTGGVVLRAHAYIDSFRRQGFREMLKER